MDGVKHSLKSKGGGNLVRWTRVVARSGEFVLERSPTRPDSYWQDIRLIRLTRGVRSPRGGKMKRVWALGWNGKRLAGSNDAQNLNYRLPEIEKWVIEILKTRVSIDAPPSGGVWCASMGKK